MEDFNKDIDYDEAVEEALENKGWHFQSKKIDNKTLFSTNVNQWFHGLIPAFFLTVVMEYLRFVVITNNPFNRRGIVFLTILLIFLNIIINTNYAALKNGYGIFVFVCVII